jgi:hypothetical protein
LRLLFPVRPRGADARNQDANARNQEANAGLDCILLTLMSLSFAARRGRAILYLRSLYSRRSMSGKIGKYAPIDSTTGEKGLAAIWWAIGNKADGRRHRLGPPLPPDRGSRPARASGLPSMIQDGSIGDGLRSTFQWPDFNKRKRRHSHLNHLNKTSPSIGGRFSTFLCFRALRHRMKLLRRACDIASSS